MPKKVIDVDELGVHVGSLKSIANTLGKLIGDEVYIHPVLEIESSEQVLKALDSVLDGVAKKAHKTKPAGQ